MTKSEIEGGAVDWKQYERKGIHEIMRGDPVYMIYQELKEDEEKDENQEHR